MGGASMAMMYANRGGGAMTYVTGAMFGVSMLTMAAMSLAGQGSKKGEVDGQRREYLRYLSQTRRKAHQAADEQRVALLWRHPDPAALWCLPAQGRMWERRSGDPDFGEVRIAVGPQKLAVTLVAPQTRPVEDLEPLTAMALRRFVRAHTSVPDLPVAVQLRAFGRIVLGGERPPVLALTRALLCQTAMFHSPDDVRIAVVAAPSRLGDWDWVKWLPHTQDEQSTDGAGSIRHLYTSMDELEAAWADDLGRRPRHSREDPPDGGTAHLVVVLDGAEVAPTCLLRGAGLSGTTVVDLSGEVPRDAGRWLLSLQVTDE
jgi:S-DNA-T family DNA segregation ATPase FtsK/SpoIIIE